LRFVGSLATLVVVIVLAVGVFSEPRPAPLMTAFLVLGALIAVAWSVRRNPWALADEVVDEGSFLVVRRRSAQARVAFDDIAEIDRDATSFARHVRLTLARSVPPFGTEVVFRPRDYASMTTEQLDRLIEELRSRAPKAASAQHATERSGSLPATAGSMTSRMTLTQKRMILACAGLLMAFAAGNFLLEWNLFAPFDKKVMVGCFVVGAIVTLFFAPTVAEMDGQIDARIARKGPKRESR
jgi:hypothetical protein